MTYALLPDELLRQLEEMGVSRNARLLYIEGIVHCATALTDGEIRSRLSRVSDAADADSLAEELITAGLWTRQALGYRVTCYSKAEGGHQRTRDQAKADQESNRRRQANYRAKVQASKAARHTVTNVVTNGPLPIPALPDPKGGKGRDGDVDGLGAPERASATTSPHVFADAFTDRCLWCQKGRSNVLHQKVPPDAEKLSAIVHERGGQEFAVRYRDDEALTVKAEFCDMTLEAQWTHDATPGRLSLTWLVARIARGASRPTTAEDVPRLEATLAALMDECFPWATTPSEYEPFDVDEETLVRVELTSHQDPRDVMAHVVPFLNLLPIATELVRDHLGQAAA